MTVERFREFCRFVLVGGANTAVYYGAYMVLLLVAPYLAAHVLAWVIALAASFLLNSYFTYRVRPTWRKALLFPLSNIPNIVMTTVGVAGLVELLHVDERLAPLIAGLLAVPATYLIARRILVTRQDADDATGPTPERPSPGPAPLPLRRQAPAADPVAGSGS